jgi:hypothetical protein
MQGYDLQRRFVTSRSGAKSVSRPERDRLARRGHVCDDVAMVAFWAALRRFGGNIP